MFRKTRLVLVSSLVSLALGCAVVPASYVPTTGKVGSKEGKSCVWRVFGVFPLSDDKKLLDQAADAAGNPTRDVAVINSIRWFIIVDEFCVTVRGD